MEVWADTGQIQGRRESQQDACSHLEWEKGHDLLILTDGMGGAAGGELAGRTAAEEFRNTFLESKEENPRRRLLAALDGANNAIYAEKLLNSALSDMGTTLIGAVVVHDLLYWVSVGDSPLWLITDGQIIRLNADHSVGGLLDMRARAGEISWEEAKRSHQRHILLEAVQGADLEYIDAPAEPHQLQPGDTVILASDGIETCSLDELLEIVTAGRPSPSDIVEAVLEAVISHNRPGQDNATLVVYRYS